ncbi:MAG: response regulator, partial [Planctomycetota bacterium]
AINQLRWHDDAPLKLKIIAEPAVRAAGGETGILETRDYRGEMVLAAFTYIPEMKWGFVAKRDLAEINAPIQDMIRDMAVLIVFSGIVVLLVSFFLARKMSNPILNMSRIVHRFTKGDLEARCPVAGVAEISDLAVSFNVMAETLASQFAIEKGGAEIAETMVAATRIQEFAEGLVKQLVRLTDSDLAAFYMRNEDGSRFDPVFSMGLTHNGNQPFHADSHEGELGKTLVTGEIVHHKNISEDTIFTHRTTAGTAIPNEIITMPLMVNDRIEAVISLATLGSYSETHRSMLEQARLNLSTAFAGLIEKTRTERLARQLGENNEQLASLNEELQEQTEELQEQAEELEAQREQVEEANKLKSEFLANMSHELRTPLNSIMALSQLMQSRGPGVKPDLDAEHLSIIERSGRNLLNLINEILDLSKIEAGHMVITCTDFDPRELMERSLAAMRPMVEEKGLLLETDIMHLPRMHSDEERINQVIINLIANAIKFTDQGKIRVEVTSADSRLQIAIEDTGIGISRKDLPHIFEEFRQADGSTTRRFEGTGLGLAICHKIVHLLGGAISVQSRLGEGSLFTVSLPLECPKENQTAKRWALPGPQERVQGTLSASCKTSPGVPHREKPFVLVVEDDEAAQLQVKTMLEETGYRVAVANDGAEALEKLRGEAPDAIVLDLMMPGINGFDFLDQIRGSISLAAIPVMVLTAKELTSTECSRLHRCRIHQLIQKGDVNREMLVDQVAGMIRHEASPESDPNIHVVTRLSQKPLSPASDPNRVVLIVEDNPDNMKTVQSILDELECEYILARDGEEAIKQAGIHQPGLILMDIQLPLLSGIEATKRIKADPVLAETPIVAMTAKSMKGDREEILAAGCDDYLTKPLDTIRVKQVVQKWLGLQGIVR